jgi:hypothetical protein
MDRTHKSFVQLEITMSESNSSRIEKATRQHVGATLTSEQIHELVKLADPTSTKGVYPSDCAYKRDEAGKLIPRGKTAYGDGVLEYLGANSFKVLPTEQIVRRPSSVKQTAAVVPAPAPVPAATPAPTAAKKGKKASTSTSKPPVATKSKANLKAAVQ